MNLAYETVTSVSILTRETRVGTRSPAIATSETSPQTEVVSRRAWMVKNGNISTV